MPLEGRRGVGTAGPCCGELGNAGDPCARYLGGEDGALARRPQAPLEVVEKLLTRNLPAISREEFLWTQAGWLHGGQLPGWLLAIEIPVRQERSHFH
jgi:hypothetical protein